MDAGDPPDVNPRPVVVRLNSETCAMIDEERKILASVGAQVVETEGADEREIATAARDCDALMVVSASVRAGAIEALRRCRLISRLGTGVDKIDVEAATRRGILVANLPDFCTDEVADHTLALLLTVARQLDLFRAAMRQGRQPRGALEVHRLSTRTLGLIGLGRIGRAVARRGRGFGMRVVAFDPGVSPSAAAEVDAEWADLDRVLSEADYLCLLCPLTSQTRNLLTAAEFHKMKQTAVLVNTGRGELVKEEDLVAALREGVIRAAAIDVYAGINVFAADGFPTEHPFFALDNLVMTPHVAAFSEESLVEQKVRGAQAVVDVLAGRWPEHLVNPDVRPWFDLAPADRS
jgi:D-3-phosphoglycerate dehydrogenase / 2-oxoglutarate reductase